MNLRQVPPRLATGAFILNSGIGKLSADDETAKSLHGMAVGTYPFLAGFEPRVFAKMLGVGEVMVGAVLLSPRTPTWLAGAVLTGFSGSLLRMYLKTPGMTMEGSIRPTRQGTAISKDVWMLGAGLGMIIDGLTPRTHSSSRKSASRRSASHAG